MCQKYDFLVIGSGIAGLTFALKAADAGSVAIVTKKEDTESNTNYAQGGIASVFDNDDSFEKHIQDTLTAGCGLSHGDAVETIVKEGPKRVEELFKLGVEFSTHLEKDKIVFDLGREGGHSTSRIVHAKDYTGQMVEKALISACYQNPNITFFQNHFALDLLTDESGESCIGAWVLNQAERKVYTFLAKITLLCSGGTGHVYLHTSNPAIATGDGLAMAYRVGAELANLEFMQFHPTTLHHPDAKSFLISEAVRGFGGYLRNSKGERFMEQYHPQAELAPRDIIARAIDHEMKKSGQPCVYLDVTHIDADRLKERFPRIYQNCLNYKLDMSVDWIPVVPAAHYICGGVLTDLNGRTSVNRLYATGEVAMTGVHGANRLASNSLLEAVVFSHQAAIDTKERLKQEKINIIDDYPAFDGEVDVDMEEILISHDRKEIQSIMWDYVGIVRSDLRLRRARERISLIYQDVIEFYREFPLTESLAELRNIALTAKLIVECAESRKESRGLHYNTDYPDRDDEHWKHDTLIIKKK
ncbi:L-aspartate oxidase [bacterium]|nr:L-aspartate oxidase [bacterium]